jgi:endonuclease/exonuclease/phosphatase family metal-dependent hydrolase
VITRLVSRHFLFAGVVLLLHAAVLSAAEKFRVATYNLENYLEDTNGTRPAKSPEARAKVRESLRALDADIVALQEIGNVSALTELRATLKSEGLDYPHWEFVPGHDTNIHVAVISKFPIVRRQSRTNESFLLNGRRFHVGRGFADVDIRITPNCTLTLVTAHLKSRRSIIEADEAELREQEALLLRELIDERLSSNPRLNLVVLGDFNDVKDSRSTKMIVGHGKLGLIDTRPAERNGDDQPSSHPHFSPRKITWTHYYGKEDSYSRIDYVLISRSLAKEWIPDETYVLALPNWGVGSDHRPVVATFFAEDK